MGFDAMAHDSSVPKDIAKKKRINRSAKLKQCKLDARREQWLSQVKNKGCCKATGMAAPPSPPLHPPRPRREEEREGPGGGLQDGELEPLARSPASLTLGRDKGRPNGSSSGSSTGSCSRSTSDAEEESGGGEDNSPLDDWEAVADALSSDADHDHHCGSDPITDHTTAPLLKTPAESVKTGSGGPAPPEPVRGPPRAWRQDDAFRPQSLPNLAKQRSFPASLERHTPSWTHRGILAAPSSCPICYEDLDPTDSSFLPCSCGFHLCLFCHKRILEDDGRCPGCRKQYSTVSGGETGVTIRLFRSCSIKY